MLHGFGVSLTLLQFCVCVLFFFFFFFFLLFFFFLFCFVFVALLCFFPTRRFVLSFAWCYFDRVIFSPLRIAMTSIGEERANLSAFRTFDLRLFDFVCLLFLLVSKRGCGL